MSDGKGPIADVARYDVATHEAAHAIVGIHLGRQLLGVQISPPQTTFETEKACSPHAWGITALSGGIAEMVIGGSDEGDLDLWQIHDRYEGAERPFLDEWHAQAVALVEAHAAEIEIVAAALYERGRLDEPDVRALLDGRPC